MNDPIIISGYGLTISITPAALNALTVDGCTNIINLFKKAASDITGKTESEMVETAVGTFHDAHKCGRGE
jgi:hypothetical protein